MPMTALEIVLVVIVAALMVFWLPERMSDPGDDDMGDA